MDQAARSHLTELSQSCIEVDFGARAEVSPLPVCVAVVDLGALSYSFLQGGHLPETDEDVDRVCDLLVKYDRGLAGGAGEKKVVDAQLSSLA